MSNKQNVSNKQNMTNKQNMSNKQNMNNKSFFPNKRINPAIPSTENYYIEIVQLFPGVSIFMESSIHYFKSLVYWNILENSS